MTNSNEYDPFDTIALFNTFLGLLNYNKNISQHREQDLMQGKLDSILDKLETIERRLFQDGDEL
jgi:hypothetical protein